MGRGIGKIKLHKNSGQAVVRIGGKEHYLGLYGSTEALEKYIQLRREFEANHGVAPLRVERKRDAPTIDELCDQFTRLRVIPYYRRDGEPTGEAANFKAALKPVRMLYGAIPTAKFGPRELKAVRQDMIARGNKRSTINRQVGRIRQMFKWAVAESIYAPAALTALMAIEGLGRGRSEAAESEGIGPVDPAHVAAASPLMPERVRVIVALLALTGARPGEICRLKPCEIDRSMSVWEYRPIKHKNAYRGQRRSVLIGPKAQAILLPWLDRKANQCCFCPADAIIDQAWEGKRRPKPGQPYNTDSLGKAIKSACRRAGVPLWHANQLRHSAATTIRAQFGIEAAQDVLGHAKPDTTTIYAERSLDRARAIMAEIG